MPRALPTQIVGYLEATIRPRQAIDFSAVPRRVGEVAGFLELYDQLPSELILLPAPEYAELVASIGIVRFGIDQFRLGKHSDCLIPVGAALIKAWDLIEKLPDAVPSSIHDLSFISDSVLQELIGLDIAAVTTDLATGEWKGATILAGSCCEALLLYGLQTLEAKSLGVSCCRFR